MSKERKHPMSKRKNKQKSGLGAGMVAFGAVFALYAALFHPHSVGGYVLALALSGFAGAVIRLMAQGLDTSVNQQTPESLKKMEAETGDPDVDALLEKGRSLIGQLRAERELVKENALVGKLALLEDECAEIFRVVYDKPGKAPQIRKFMEYYLPTTLKLVRGYRMLDERGVDGEEALKARARVDESLGVVLQGCEKLLDKLYQDDVLDLTTDIDVLEQMLRRDGLTESELEAAASQARRAAQIDEAVERIARQKQQTAAVQQPKAKAAAPRWHIDPRFQQQDTAQARKPEEE